MCHSYSADIVDGSFSRNHAWTKSAPDPERWLKLSNKLRSDPAFRPATAEIAACEVRAAGGDETFTLSSAVAYTRDFDHDDLTERDLRRMAELLLETADKLHTINKANR